MLARSVQETALHFQEQLIEAGLGRGKTKQRALARADVDLTKLRFYLRLCRDLELLKPRQYRHVAGIEVDTGRIYKSPTACGKCR